MELFWSPVINPTSVSLRAWSWAPETSLTLRGHQPKALGSSSPRQGCEGRERGAQQPGSTAGVPWPARCPKMCRPGREPARSCWRGAAGGSGGLGPLYEVCDPGFVIKSSVLAGEMQSPFKSRAVRLPRRLTADPEHPRGEKHGGAGRREGMRVQEASPKTMPSGSKS